MKFENERFQNNHRFCPEKVVHSDSLFGILYAEVKQMNMLKQLNRAMDYIESNLCAEFDLDEAADIACVTADSFNRFFSTPPVCY